MNDKSKSKNTLSEQVISFGSGSEGYIKTLRITKTEAAKVSHDINSVWHTRYYGKRYCRIETHSHRRDSPSYVYHFINHGFDQYEFVGKYPTQDRR